MVAPPENKLACLNPAIGVTTCLFMSFFKNMDGLKYIWMYGLFPFLGAIVAVLFHEFIYKKIHFALRDAEI